MATLNKNGTRAVSPPVRVKRERSEDDREEETRRVSQRTDENETHGAANGTPVGANAVENAAASITEYVKTISRSDDENVIKATMRKLCICLHGEEQRSEKQQEFLRVGGPITVVSAMQKHTDNYQIQSNGIIVLMNATCKYENNQLKSVIAEIDGIEAIIAAMNAHPAESGIQRRGLKALRNMSLLEKNAEKLVLQLDGVPLIIETMTKFSTNVDLIHEACRLLCVLSDYEKLRKPMIDANVPSALAKAIEGHKDNGKMQNRARGAMKQLL